VKALKGFVSNFGPYLLVEMLMPGGSLIALGMYLYRRKGDLPWLPKRHACPHAS
jgi:hypothetical protein